jgi:hypothetical protein
MSPDNGRSVQYHPPPPATTTSRRIFDERRYSPDALERQLNAELHLLDGVEASMTQVENMERLRSVALAQQEVVSLAQVLKNVESSISLLRSTILLLIETFDRWFTSTTNTKVDYSFLFFLHSLNLFKDRLHDHFPLHLPPPHPIENVVHHPHIPVIELLNPQVHHQNRKDHNNQNT